jgi:hypothetical protein
MPAVPVPLSAEERAQLAQYAQAANAPPPAPAADPAIAAFNARPNPLAAPTPPPDFRNTVQPGAPGTANAHVAGEARVVNKDMTVGMQPAPPAPAAPQYAPTTVIPAHWQAQTRAMTEQKGVDYSKETKGALAETEKHGKEAVRLAGEAGVDTAARDARIAGMQATQLEADQAAEDARKTLQAGQLAQEKAKLDELTKTAGDARVDPNHFWSSKSTGQKVAVGIASVLAMGLDGAFKGLTGRSVGALEQFNRIIDQDIDAQRANIAQGDKAVEQQKGIYALTRQQFADEDTRVAAARVMAKEALQARIAEVSAGTNDKIAKARAEQLMQQNAKEILALREHFDETSASKIQSQLHEAYKPQQVIGGGPAGPKSTKYDPKMTVRGPDGKTYLVPQGEDMQKKSAAVTDIQRNIARALELRKGLTEHERLMLMGGDKTPDVLKTARVKELESLAADTATKRTVAAGQGAMSKGDEANSNAAIGAMLGFSGSNDQVLQHTAERFGSEFSSALAAQGAQHAQIIEQVNPQTGLLERRVIPGATYTGPEAAPAAGAIPGFVPSGGGK